MNKNRGKVVDIFSRSKKQETHYREIKDLPRDNEENHLTKKERIERIKADMEEISRALSEWRSQL